MPEFIRVRFRDSGTEQSIPTPSAIDSDAYEVLDEPAVDHNERILPPVVADAPTLDDLTVAELKDEIANRNAGREESDQIPTTGNKPDLIAAISADDNREGEQ